MHTTIRFLRRELLLRHAVRSEATPSSTTARRTTESPAPVHKGPAMASPAPSPIRQKTPIRGSSAGHPVEASANHPPSRVALSSPVRQAAPHTSAVAHVTRPVAVVGHPATTPTKPSATAAAPVTPPPLQLSTVRRGTPLTRTSPAARRGTPVRGTSPTPRSAVLPDRSPVPRPMTPTQRRNMSPRPTAAAAAPAAHAAPTRAEPAPAEVSSASQVTANTVNVGERVFYKGKEAIVRFNGSTTFASGNWVGLEMLEAGSGLHDGSSYVDRKRYFTCPKGTGVFVRASQLSREANTGVKE